MSPAKLPTRALGKNGPQVTALGFGLMGLSSFYGSVGSDEERFKVLDRAYELGALNWDSADIYGDSEELVGKWLKRTGKRDEIFIATKFAAHIKPDGTRTVENSPEYIRKAIDKSLSRLQIDTVDLYYCHRFSGEVPVEDVVETMAELKNAGKIRHIGLSECSADTLRRAHAIHPIAAVQLEYSPFSMDIENPAQGDLLKLCRELGVATIAYSPLGRGFLTGGIQSRDDFEDGDFRKFAPRFSEEHFADNLKLVHHIQELAKKKNCTSGQLTLAWLMAQGEDIIPIPGTKKIKYLEENMGALDVKISDAENKEIRQAIEAVEVKGGRYPEAMQSALFADTPKRK